ncbi:MAG: L,D-transpeptidase family protein [Lachnospiraceae bacterium]|nr:L,D-transpeptidase family protein [Lachnospiraceae bacterium]
MGFHDADWQTAFGGSRYLYYDPHGCINMRPFDAAAFYDMISVGDPVIIHN